MREKLLKFLTSSQHYQILCFMFLYILSPITDVIQYIQKHHKMLKTKDQLVVTFCFYLTSYALNMFWTLIYPSSEDYDYSVELPPQPNRNTNTHRAKKAEASACNADTTPTQPH